MRSRFLSFAALCFVLLPSMVRAAAFSTPTPVQIQVDATDTIHKVFSVRELIPLHGDASITLSYPSWEIASHAPTISVADLAGLEFRLNGKLLPWRRDPLNVSTFHVSLPAEGSLLEVRFDYLSPLSQGVMTRNIVQVQWEHMLLYPQGAKVSDIPVVARLKLPNGFKAASSLHAIQDSDSTLTFQQCTMSELADAPVFAGRFLKSWPLSGSVWLHAVADDATELDISPELLGKLREVVAQADSIFSGKPFPHYDFLVSLSDMLPSDGGTEHQMSSEIALPADFFVRPDQHKQMAALFPHEYIHAWNGLYHRPAGMAVSDFNTPIQDSMLWVYEGLTELYGLRIARDSGLISDQDYRDELAIDAAEQLFRPGRHWKSLADSDYDPVYLAGHHIAWRDWERREDYYQEGPLLWLGIEAQIRISSGGKKGLNDFARTFLSARPNHSAIAPYTFSDLVTALNSVAPHAWQDYLAVRLDAHDESYLRNDLEAAGYSLLFNSTESEALSQQESEDNLLDLSYSIGASVRAKGVVQSVTWHGIAFEAGLAPGMTIVTVNNEPFSIATLRRNLQSASTAGIRLTVRAEGQDIEEIVLKYNGGLRFPHLVTIN